MEYSRVWDESRKRQGFRSQAHLDAFFRAFDHARGCPVCSTVAGHVPLDDGMQPVLGRCSVAKEMDKETERVRSEAKA